MKALSTLCLSLIAAALLAGPRCERLSFYDTGSLMRNIDKDLTSHVWTTGMLGKASKMYFQEDGSALVLPDGTSDVEIYTWDLESCSGQVYLRIFSRAGDEAFLVSPTCSGLCVSAEGKCAELLLTTDDEVSMERAEFLRLQLTGTWAFDPDRAGKRRGAMPFSLNLQADGTFVLNMGPDHYHTMQDGIWQVAPDGAYLILFTRVVDQGGVRFVAETVSIRSMDFEDLVVEGQGLPRVLKSCGGKQPLYLTKETA